MSAPARRIIVLGCSGSGKSTLAAALAERLGLPFVASDPVYWQFDWSPTPAAEVRAWVAAASAAEAWVIDGNFDAESDLLWARAELAVWLDLPLVTTLWWVTRRNLGWWLSRAPVWAGNRMTWRRAWSGVAHAWRSHGLKRAAYPGRLAAFANLGVVRIGSPRALARWLADVEEWGVE